MAGNNDNPCAVIVHGNITIGVNLMAIEPPDAEFFLRIPFTARAGETEGYAACADITMPDEETLNNALTFANGNNILILDRRDSSLLARVDCDAGYVLNSMAKPLYCCNSTRQPTAEEVAAGWQVVNI